MRELLIIPLLVTVIALEGVPDLNDDRGARQYDISRKIIKKPPVKSQEISIKPANLQLDCGLGREYERIVGGSEAQPGSYPWMAAIFVKSARAWRFLCGGSLISRSHVVTAAHCVAVDDTLPVTDIPARRLRIRLGDHNLTSSSELPDGATLTVGVSHVRRHADFDPAIYKNDIAVLKLDRAVRFSKFIQPVCIPTDVLSNLEHQSAIVTGWGTTRFAGRRSDVLKQAVIRVWTQKECQTAFEDEIQITGQYICAGDDQGKKDACQADSGGPLIFNDAGRYYLIGVVSFGKKCATPGYPGVYTRMTEYSSWLRDGIN